MTVESLFRVLTQIIFLYIAGITLFNWLRERKHIQLSIALVFVSLALTIVLQDIQPFFPSLSTVFSIVITAAFLVHPYFLLRLVQHFYPIPILVQRFAFLGLLFIFPSFVFVSTAPFLLLGLVGAYFTFVEGYASYIIVRGALTIKGILGNRLRLAALGSAVLAFIFFLILVLVIIILLNPDFVSPPWLSTLGQILFAISGLGYYLGFSPPRWLRQNWQYKEFYNFLHRTSKQLNYDRISIFKELLTSALQTVGGTTGLVAGWDLVKNQFAIEVQSEPPLQVKSLDTQPAGLSEAWQTKRTRLLQIPDEVSPEMADWAEKFGARTLFVVPIIGSLQPWGLLIIALRYEPLFEQDDLDLLSLLVVEMAISLDKAALVYELEQRQIALEVANKELEAFSYSVSHDLRAPLRAINGFSQALINKNADALNESGKHYLSRIQENTNQMGQLIDDLLSLSRISRREMRQDTVDLTALAKDIDTELRSQQPEREILFEVDDQMEGKGDSDLIRIALQNLINNSWKFTSSHPQAKIQVGILPGESNSKQKVFFVRDNGVGFDMAYANKLFGAFQRLHSAAEFPGTGIGLATVQRIINRHGGRIWAEAEPQKGATFYFTLGENI